MHGINEDYGIVKYYQYRQAMSPLQWQGVETRRPTKNPSQRPSVLIHPKIVRISLSVMILLLVCGFVVMHVSNL